MQIKTTLIAAMAAFATACAQDPDVSQIPDCCIDCIINTNPLSGCKDIMDFRCLCQTNETYNERIATCIVEACSDFNDVLTMINWKTETCALYGIVWP